MVSQGSLAAISWSESESAYPIAEDFESYPAGLVTGILDINIGAASEIFVGQSVSIVGQHDVVTGVPTNPLTLEPSTDEIEIYPYQSGQVVTAGNTVYFSHGAISILFDVNYTEFGMDVVGVDGNSELTLQFFDRTGASVGTAVAPMTSDASFTFTSDSSAFAGVTITQNDGAGIGYDALRVGGESPDVPIGPPVDVPTLSDWALLLLTTLIGLAGILGVRGRQI